MAIKFLSDVLGSGELEGVTIEATDNITIGGSSNNALTISSGDVVVGGSSGTSGQVLTSNGSGNGTSWTAKTTNSNDFLTGLSFNTGTGVLTATVTNQTNPTVDLDGRYLQLGGGVMTGNIQITTITTTSATGAIGSVSTPIPNIYADNLSGNLKGTLASTVTATTATVGNDSTLVATTAFVVDAIAEIPDANTTYDLTTLPTGTGLRLDPSSGTNDDITFTGSGGLTITRNSDTQLTFNAPSASSTPTLDAVTTAGSTTSNAISVGTITNTGSITTTTSASVGTNLTVFGTANISGLVTGQVGFGINYVSGATVPMVNLANAPTYGIFYREATPDFIEFKHANVVKQSFDGSGNVTFAGNITLGDDHTIGDDGDDNLEIKSSSNENVIIDGNQVLLRDDGDTKLQTLSSGVTVTGTATATTFSGDLNGTINTLTTAATQSASNNSTLVATTAYVDAAIGTIPAGLVFQGNWNANSNTPTLTSGSGTTGHFYIVSIAGNTNLDGITSWAVGDWAIFVEQGATDQWEKIDNSNSFTGFGTSGTVARFTGTTQLADSTISDNGTDVTMTGDLTVSGGEFTLGSSATTTIGKNLLKVPDITAIRFIRLNANETVDTLSASSFRSAIGAGTSSTTGTVTSVAALTLGTTGTNLSSTVSGGSGAAVITLNVPTASAANRGALSSTDWSTFNSKTSNTGTVTGVTGTSPIVSDGSSTTPAISINTASGSATGALSSTDWSTFNGKMPLTNISSNYDATGSKAFLAVGLNGNSNALTYSTDMYYVAGSPSELVTPKLGVTNGITGASLTISGTSALDTITSDKDITFTSGTSGGTGVVYDATLITDATYSGEVAYFGNSTSTNQGRLYQLQTTGGWAYADADTVAGSSGLLAVALGTNSDDGMLLRGFIRNVNYAAIDGTAGAKLYVNTSTNNNSFTADIPTGSGDVVRIVGYITTASSKTIYFCPDNTFIQLA